MTHELLSLDFYGSELVAARAVFDEEAATITINRLLRQPCRGFSGARVLDKTKAQEELSALIENLTQEATTPVSVIVGVRGSFLSFRRASGFSTVASRNYLIGIKDIENALHNAVPASVKDRLEVVDIFPQSYTIDGNEGIVNPKGKPGCTLEAVTFLSLAEPKYLQDLRDVFKACGCPEFHVLPSGIAQADRLLRANEKEAGALFIDIGTQSTSAVMYFQNTLVDTWEMPLGKNSVIQAVAEVLQNDLETTADVLKSYKPGTDEIIDDVLEEAKNKLVNTIKKELQQSLLYVQHPCPYIVLSGLGADKKTLGEYKKALSARKARLAETDRLALASYPKEPLVCTGALSLITHALVREVSELSTLQEKPAGFIGNLLDKIGLGELF